MHAAWLKRGRLGAVYQALNLRRAGDALAIGLAAATAYARGFLGRVKWSLESFRIEHGRISAIAVIALLGLLVLAGLAMARVVAAGPEIVNADIATHYVNVPDRNASQLKAVTYTTAGKVVHVRKVVRKPGRVTTSRDTLTVSHPSFAAGPTTTVQGPSRTVTVSGPTHTVTQTVVTTVTVEVTTTEKGHP